MIRAEASPRPKIEPQDWRKKSFIKYSQEAFEKETEKIE